MIGGSDLVIGLSYISITICLFWIARRTVFGFSFICVCFGGFIVSCGIGHLIDVVTLYIPAYGATVLIRLLTASVSATTAVILWLVRQRTVELVNHGQA